MFASEQTRNSGKPKTSIIVPAMSVKMKTHTSNTSSSRLHFSAGLAVVMAIAVPFLGGCSDTPKSATQTVAKIYDEEISVHQVNNALAQLPRVAPENMDVARREVLDKLVNQQLAVHEAMNLKLDRSPAVMMQIDASRREILARAYINKLVAGVPKPSAEDSKKFFTENPDLFTQRRIYTLQEITVLNPHPPLAEIKKMAANKSMADIAAELKQKNIPYSNNSGTRAAEQIALPLLAQLSKLEDGQTTIIETPQTLNIIRIESSRLMPVPEEIALRAIPQYLMNEKINIAVNDNIERLKNSAKIEYMNASGKDAPATKNASVTPAAVLDNSGKQSNSTERGIAGIK